MILEWESFFQNNNNLHLCHALLMSNASGICVLCSAHTSMPIWLKRKSKVGGIKSVADEFQSALNGLDLGLINPWQLELSLLFWNRINICQKCCFLFAHVESILIFQFRRQGRPLLFAYCNSLQDNYGMDLLKKEATCLHYFTAFRKVGYMTFTKCCSN